MKEWKSPIPKKVHLIWIGGEQPDYMKYFLKSFKENMPEFEIRVWGNKELNKNHFPLTYEYIKKVKKYQGKPMREEKELGGHIMRDKNMKPYLHSKWAQITDLMRLEIVYREGGFYFDTTFEVLKPMYNLLNKRKGGKTTLIFRGFTDTPLPKVRIYKKNLFSLFLVFAL